MGADRYGCGSCDCPRCVANQGVIQAAEMVVKQYQYGLRPDMKALENAILEHWKAQREAKAGVES